MWFSLLFPFVEIVFHDAAVAAFPVLSIVTLSIVSAFCSPDALNSLPVKLKVLPYILLWLFAVNVSGT